MQKVPDATAMLLWDPTARTTGVEGSKSPGFWSGKHLFYGKGDPTNLGFINSAGTKGQPYRKIFVKVLTTGASAVAQWVKPHLQHQLPIWMLVPVQLLHFPLNSLLMGLGKQQNMVQMLRSPPLMWETQMKFQAIGFSMAQPWPVWLFGKWSSLSSPSRSNCLSNK